MSVKYIPNGNAKIVINKITYQNDGDKKAVLPVDKLSKEELDGLLKRKFIVKLDLAGLADPATPATPATPPASNPATSTGKNTKQKNKPGQPQEQPQEQSQEQPQEHPQEAKPREELLKEAQEAGVTVTDEMTDEEIQKLIAEAKGEQAQ